MSDVSDILVRYLVDEGFRAEFDGDLDGVLARFELDDETRDALRARDERVLGLIGRAVGPEDTSIPTEAPPTPPASRPTPKLPGIELWLQVVPIATGEGEDARIQWHVSLLPSRDQPPAVPSGAAGAAILYRIALEPHTTATDEGLHVTFGSTFTLDGETSETTAPAPTPWGHDPTSAETKRAADAVREASPEDRYEAILRLIDAIGGPS